METTTVWLDGDHTATVDTADYDRVSAFPWHYHQAYATHLGGPPGNTDEQVYVYRNIAFGIGGWTTERLENFILELPQPHGGVRFVDGNALHCTRDNMRIVP